MLLPTADIEWRNGAPLSKTFGDYYFQTEGGLEESCYVFLEANALREKLLDTESGNETLVIAETGFGSGLNFIACYALWQSLPHPKKRLEFISIEGFPVSAKDLSRIAEHFPALSPQYSNLIKQYPEPIQGSHLLRFERDHVRLRLLFHSIESALDQYSVNADIWFLDGFSPKANEAMWSEKLFQYIAAHARPNTSLSTFTSASVIRKGLSSAGFKVSKKEGFGPKREMITAVFSQAPNDLELIPSYQPWHLSDPTSTFDEAKLHSEVVVVGAGIAGLVQALTLSRQGFKVILIDKAPKPLAGASSQPQLIMYAKYPKQVNAEGILLLHAHSMAQAFYALEQSESKEPFWHSTGLAQLAWNESETTRQSAFIQNYALPNTFVRQLSAKELSTRSRIPIESTGLFFSNSGWLDTKAFASYVLKQKGIRFLGSTEVTRLTQNDNQTNWVIETTNLELQAENIVLCNAYGVNKLIPELELPLKQLRGQTTQLDSKEISKLSCVLCGEGYLCPTGSSELHIGATYDLQHKDDQYREEDNSKNVKQLGKWLTSPTANALKPCMSKGGKAGLRTTCADYTPVVGPAPNVTKMKDSLAPLKHNAKACQSNYGHYLPGLYINVAYGSKGLTFAPMCADLIASQIRGAPTGEPHQIRKMLAPARFLIRTLKKG